MKAIKTYITEKLRISTNTHVNTDIFADDFNNFLTGELKWAFNDYPEGYTVFSYTKKVDISNILNNVFKTTNCKYELNFLVDFKEEQDKTLTFKDCRFIIYKDRFKFIELSLRLYNKFKTTFNHRFDAFEYFKDNFETFILEYLNVHNTEDFYDLLVSIRDFTEEHPRSKTYKIK